MQIGMYHKPVLLNESVEGLELNPSGVYVDVTFGGGGHSRFILDKLNDSGRLFGFDQDRDALKNELTDPRFKLINQNFTHTQRFLRLENVRKVDGILADLGISSHQIDTAERGFSIRYDAELDMRMNADAPFSARDVINEYSQARLADVIYFYGEINNARKLASVIVERRKGRPINRISELIDIVHPWIKGQRNQYLARLFQAIRIEVNGEMEALKALLEQSVELLDEGGRLVVISYHSIEDRIVKNFIKTGSFEGNETKDLFGKSEKPFRMVNKKVIIPTDEEVMDNNRSRSAKLRIAEKL